MIKDPPPKSKSEIRKENVAQLRKVHEPFFATLSTNESFFDAKAKNVIKPVGKIGFFKSQLDFGQDLYFELTGFKQEIVDTNRTLYKLPYNPHYNSDSRYEFVEETPAGAQYYIDLSICEVVKFPEEEKEELFFEEVVEDCPASALTGRDHACIQLKIARSQKPWLNSLIIESKKP